MMASEMRKAFSAKDELRSNVLGYEELGCRFNEQTDILAVIGISTPT